MSEFDYEQFIKVASEFKLGSLTTESYHSLTHNLSEDSKYDLPQAIKTLKSVDVSALNILKNKTKEIYNLYLDCQATFKAGGKVYLAGCGATGRLSLALESFSLQKGITNVIGFMAGGDFALIKSVESFEDRMSYGSRQLLELGFTDNDLLVAITEGGETSFVIGAAMEAEKASNRNPYFLYCNPDEEILHLERCKNVIENKKINKLNLTSGAMALSGSTRMQATTIQMLVAGCAILFKSENFEEFETSYLNLIDSLIGLDYSFLNTFIELESKTYVDNGFVTYTCSQDLALSILTDTTERSPTFSLKPFESQNDDFHSLCFLTIKNTNNSPDAWRVMLGREPRALDWGNLDTDVGLNAVHSYDISNSSLERRSKLEHHEVFEIYKDSDMIVFKLKDYEYRLEIEKDNILSYQLSLKLLLNTLSTLIMGRLNRYESNIMTWVKPSNFKLIDRSARYVIQLLKRDGIDKSYKEVVKSIIENSDQDLSENPIVLRVYNALKG